MHFEHLAINLERQCREYSIGKPASEAELIETEERLNIKFPTQVRQFYEHYNGFTVESSRAEILPLSKLTFISPHLLLFAIIDQQHQICFDTSYLNEAEEWFIVSATDEYKITFTIASFFANQIWHWIRHQRPIWTDWEH